MKKLTLVAFAVSLLGAGAPPAMGPTAAAGADGATPLSTDRKVHGVITAVDPATLTIASAQRSVTGRIDPARTKVTLNGKPATASALQLTAHAKGELCLDDVWLVIDTH